MIKLYMISWLDYPCFEAYVNGDSDVVNMIKDNCKTLHWLEMLIKISDVNEF